MRLVAALRLGRRQDRPGLVEVARERLFARTLDLGGVGEVPVLEADPVESQGRLDGAVAVPPEPRGGLEVVVVEPASMT
ncbi:hypothetical protein UB45_13245 [Terrabacter sp. 28]|nr:hypothetical protein UB45_13245 [Terrabacter sp. 28]